MEDSITGESINSNNNASSNLDVNKTIKNLKKCIPENKQEILKKIRKIPDIINQRKDELIKGLGDGMVSKRLIKTKLNLIIEVVNKEFKEIKNLISCLVKRLPQQITNLNNLQKQYLRGNIYFSKSASKFGVNNIFLKDFEDEITAVEFNEKVTELIDNEMENTIKPMVESGTKLAETTFNAVDNQDISGLQSAFQECIEKFDVLGGKGSKSPFTIEKGSGTSYDDSSDGSDLSNNNKPGTNPISDFADSAKKMHEQGTLKDYINSILESVGLYFGVFFLLITMPAMPVIFYLSILYNVILLTWEKFKGLDTY